jgi:hypothetical protein
MVINNLPGDKLLAWSCVTETGFGHPATERQLKRVRSAYPPGINERSCGTAIVRRHRTNLVPVILRDNLWLSRVRKPGRRCQNVRTELCHVRLPRSEFDVELLRSLGGPAANARARSGDLVSPVVRQHDEHVQRRRAIRPPAGGFRNAIRCCNEWT